MVSAGGYEMGGGERFYVCAVVGSGGEGGVEMSVGGVQLKLR